MTKEIHKVGSPAKVGWI